MRSAAAVVSALLLAAVAPAGAQPLHPFVPIGVVDDRPGGRTLDGIEELRKLRFTVLGRRDSGVPGGVSLEVLRPPRAGAFPSPAPIPSAGVTVIGVTPDTSGAHVRQQAWLALARGDRGILFDGWTALRGNPDALEAAASFADVVTRNAALFAPLRPRDAAGDVRVDAPPSEAVARFLESTDALVLVAANLTEASRKVTMTFSPEMPEAIWQNMETGAAVNFVAGPAGPIYTPTLAPRDVIVLMIRKQYK